MLLGIMCPSRRTLLTWKAVDLISLMTFGGMDPNCYQSSKTGQSAQLLSRQYLLVLFNQQKMSTHLTLCLGLTSQTFGEY